jgi:pimeloyl-ACP methyl ester carboxylesterase
MLSISSLAEKIAAKGFRVLLHDRRNCGQSSLFITPLEFEKVFWADDLHELLQHLDLAFIFIVGQSGGTCIAVKFAIKYPRTTKGLLLWGISSGPIAARLLDDYYYSKLMRAAFRGGMAAVCNLDLKIGNISDRPENRSKLLAMDPDDFFAALQSWRRHFLKGTKLTFMGAPEVELKKIAVPVTIVPYYDKIHPVSAARYASETMPKAKLFDYNSSQDEKPMLLSLKNIAQDEEIIAIILYNQYQHSQHRTD